MRAEKHLVREYGVKMITFQRVACRIFLTIREAFLTCYTKMATELDCVIGTAMSKGDQNQEFDILLRHSHLTGLS